MTTATARALGFALVAGLATAHSALAQESAASRLYVGATFGQAHWRSACSNAANCDDTDRALRVLAGYQINGTFAAEVGFHNFGDVTGGGATLKANAWEALAVARWPFGSALSGYGKLGAYRGNAKGSGTLIDTKDTNYNVTYGFGLQLDLSRNISLRGEWQAYPGLGGGSTGVHTDIDVLSAGVLWHF